MEVDALFFGDARAACDKKDMIKAIEITPPGDIPAEKQEKYKELKERYTILTQQQIRSDADREEMEELIRRAQELYSTSSK